MLHAETVTSPENSKIFEILLLSFQESDFLFSLFCLIVNRIYLAFQLQVGQENNICGVNILQQRSN